MSFEQATQLLDTVFEGQVSEVQIAAFLTAMRTKGVSAPELAGLARSLRKHAVAVNADVDNLVDTCGTGGAGLKTFNISTTAALVAAGAACFALFSVLSKTITHEPLGVTSVYFLSACIASLLSMLYFSEFALPSTSEILPVLLNGILVNGFSYVFWIVALQSTEASYLAPFTFLTPVLSAIYLIVFFDEPFVLAYGIGLVCVVGGGLVNSIGCMNEAA